MFKIEHCRVASAGAMWFWIPCVVLQLTRAGKASSFRGRKVKNRTLENKGCGTRRRPEVPRAKDAGGT